MHIPRWALLAGDLATPASAVVVLGVLGRWTGLHGGCQVRQDGVGLAAVTPWASSILLPVSLAYLLPTFKNRENKNKGT